MEDVIKNLVNEMIASSTEPAVVPTEPTTQTTTVAPATHVAPTEPAVQPTTPATTQPAGLPPELASLLEKLNGNIEGLGQSLKPQVQPTEEELAIEEAKSRLGMNNLAQTSQIEELKAQLAEMQGREIFKEEWHKIESEFQGLTKEELGAYAKSKGLEAALNNPASWKTIASMMKAEAAPKPAEPQVVSTAGTQVKEDTAEKIKKGETVSDIELGEYLLNGG
jgi:hypothetical protein